MHHRLRSIATNSALVVVSLALGYFALQMIFFRVVLPNVQLDVRPYLPETVGVLVQTTKSQFVPKDYLAILGDSYAEGIGDWSLVTAGNEARAFHSAHVIRQLTGLDVVSFGKGGLSSAEALVRQPAHIFAGSHCAIFPNIDKPKRILAFFYEGNDIQDNLAFRHTVERAYGRADVDTIDRFLSEKYGSVANWRCQLHFGDVISRMIRYSMIYHFKPLDLRPAFPGGNALRVAGMVIDAPAPLQGPALEIDDAGMAAGVEVFDRSLAWLRGHFQDVSIGVVYVPSTLSIYQLAGESYIHVVEPEDEGKRASASAPKIARNSDKICNLIRDASTRHRVGFIDARPALRAAAERRLIHGPVDWGHLNKAGYVALGEMLARRIGRETEVDTCG